MNCTRCEGTGFINLHQLPEVNPPEGVDEILKWIDEHEEHDVQVCDCCGDGEWWYGEPGEHYHSGDPRGADGPYAYNGGLCKCH